MGSPGNPCEQTLAAVVASPGLGYGGCVPCERAPIPTAGTGLIALALLLPR